MDSLRIAIIGCGDAGLSAAFAASRENPHAKITVISEDDSYYARCPLPYVASGQVSEKVLLMPLKRLFYGTNISVLIDRAIKISSGKVECNNSSVDFDKAIIATGGYPKRVADSLTLRTIHDALEIHNRFAGGRKPTIVGAGMLGCELADLLGGCLYEKEDRILSLFDPEFSEKIHIALRNKGVNIVTGSKIIPQSDFLISAIGVTPNVELAEKSGIRTSQFGIVVDNYMRTSMPDVYAAGDCIEERCLFSGKPFHSYLGPQAEREGAIAGTNAAGGEMKYNGSLSPTVAKIAGFELGKTGLSTSEAEQLGKHVVSAKAKVKTKPDYLPFTGELMLKLIFCGELLVGCQAVGTDGVEGVINLASYAMQHGATADDLTNLAYCFSPPVCSAPNPIILCAESAKRRMRK